MKKIDDPVKISSYIHQYHIDSLFTEVPDMELHRFQKGEMINAVLNPAYFFLFFVSGSVHLSNIRIDGSLYEIGNLTPFSCFGDMEFASPDFKQYSIQADSECDILSVNLMICRESLKKDPVFLYYLLNSVCKKLQLSSKYYAETSSLEERLLYYMEYNCHNQIITGITKTANELGCSRRQLQRILVKLTENQQIKKLAKGTYQKN